jgi:isoleucyl-tRNA synthetase
MAVVMDIVVQGRSARNVANTKIRQPLAEMFVSLAKPISLSDELLDVIKDELNVKAIRFIESADEYMSYKFKPQLRTLGPRYGKIVPKIAEALNVAPNDVMVALKAGSWKSSVEGVDVELSMEDVLVETMQKDGFSAASEKGVTVVLNVSLTPELIEEGNMRELISKFQNMRREAGFEVTDHISAGYHPSKEGNGLAGVLERNKDEISREILATEISGASAPSGAFAKEWSINGEKINLWVMR